MAAEGEINTAGASSPASTMAAMPKEVLAETLSYLTLPELGACHSVCKSIHEACLDPLLWRGLAVRAYGEEIVNASSNLYPEYKTMVIDDNSLGAMPTIDNGIVPCPYLANRMPDYYFLCLISCVKYHRPSNEIRVYIDARGESDLRSPGDSSFERKSLDFDGNFEPMRPASDDGLLQGRFVSEIAEEVPGHFKGYISYCSNNFSRRGRYYFTFADVRTNAMLQFWGGAFVDYPTVPLLEVREENGLLKAFANKNGKVEYTTMASPFENDTDAEERRRFEGFVEDTVLQRHLHPRRAARMGRRGDKWWV